MTKEQAEVFIEQQLAFQKAVYAYALMEVGEHGDQPTEGDYDSTADIEGYYVSDYRRKKEHGIDRVYITVVFRDDHSIEKESVVFTLPVILHLINT